MEILDNIIAENLFLYLKDYQTLIISDVHIGYEESLNRQGIMIPRKNYTDLTILIEKTIHEILKNYSIKHIIINGDLIHDFAKVPPKVKDSVNRFIKFLKIYGNIKIIIGNHDKALKYIIDEPTTDNVVLGDILIIHGDKILEKKLLKDIKTIIIGHEHPAINITSGARSEKYKCFIKGKYSNKDLIVMPSCNILIEGTDISKENLLSPILKSVDIKKFEIYIIEDKIYDFGKLKDII